LGFKSEEFIEMAWRSNWLDHKMDKSSPGCEKWGKSGREINHSVL